MERWLVLQIWRGETSEVPLRLSVQTDATGATGAVERGLAALGDATRRRIVERLAEGPCAVGDIARSLPVGRPAVSMHLRVLRDAGLVRDERAGNRRLYHLDPQGLALLRARVDAYWSRALGEF